MTMTRPDIPAPDAADGVARGSLAEQPAGLAENLRLSSRRVFADGALPASTRQLIALAVAHVARCPICVRAHTAAALRRGATAQQLREAAWIAADVYVGAVHTHGALPSIALTRPPESRLMDERIGVSGVPVDGATSGGLG